MPAASPNGLIGSIPLTARSVLEVGCGEGQLLALYRSFNPAARLCGIELDPALAARAADHLDHAGNDAPPDESFDCIIYQDLFGYAQAAGVNPWALIRTHLARLTPDGVILLRTANPGHWRHIEQLLRGTSEGAPVGPSPQIVHDVLTAAGLIVCDVRAEDADTREARTFAAALSPGLTAIGVDPDAFQNRAAASRHVWRLLRTARPRLTIAGNMMAPVGGVSHVRVLQPLAALATDPSVTVAVTDRIGGTSPADGEARIFILHRPSLSGPEGMATLRMLMDAGWLVVTEFDDHPDYLRVMRAGERLSFQGVHAIQTTNENLAAVLRTRNPEVGVFPNAIPALPEARNFADPRAITFFFGALNRDEDWHPLISVINEVATMAGGRLRFQVVHDAGFFDALTTPHKAFTPLCDYETYMDLLGRCEIAFMPLADNGFNRAKSDLKFIEAAACRVAPLASHVVYGASIDDGRTGLLFHDATELRARLLRLVAMPELARDIGDAARAHVAAHRMLAYQTGRRIAWYRSLWERRDALTAALRARLAVPERTAG